MTMNTAKKKRSAKACVQGKGAFSALQWILGLPLRVDAAYFDCFKIWRVAVTWFDLISASVESEKG